MSNTNQIDWLTKYLRLTNYLGAAQLYLRDNFLLEEKLKPEHIKKRILGHWGTVPGINFIWACLNHLITKTQQEMLLIVGPGHGYPAIQANLFVEGSLGEFYKSYDIQNGDSHSKYRAFSELIKKFSWPGGFPSHSNPMTPGCILEGGELGYSLSTAFGAAFDNPDLIVPCIIGDGEAETGPLAASWHSNKFLNPITSGAVLPILHLNGYKISGPTIFGTMDNEELIKYFDGLHYDPIIIEGAVLFEPMIAALEASFVKIKQIQDKARSTGKIEKPRWPVILLKSPKGWFGPKPKEEGKPIVGSFRSHGIPLEPLKSEHEFELLKDWLESYKVHELINADYSIKKEVLEYVPLGNLRMGMNKHARSIERKDLQLPALKHYEVDTSSGFGKTKASSTNRMAQYIRDVFKLNDQEKNFRLFSPDESESNKLHPIFETTNRAYLWPIKSHDENLSPDGRVMEILSEHTLEGWMQGYTLTGRHGIFVTYEAFAEIISSMVDQYAKFIRHSSNIGWRKPTPSLNFVLTSLAWRQDHNGFSHQNPGFVSSMLNNHADYISVYFPPDANTMLAVTEETLRSHNKINIIVAGKRDLPQWLSLEKAREQVNEDIKIWEFVSDENPDVVMVGCGDYAMNEIMSARYMMKKMIPDIKIRIINITELSCFGIGDNNCKCRISDFQFDEVFTKDRPIIFNYHGYSEDIKSLIFNHHAAARFNIHGYSECGTTTTPFDMVVQNKVDRISLSIEAIKYASVYNSKVKEIAEPVINQFKKLLDEHKEYIIEYGVDMPEIQIDF